MTFLIAWFICCAVAGLTMAGAFNYDRVAVFVLRMLNAPVYEEARMIAALLYQHPEQWKVDAYSVEHPKVGKVRGYLYVGGVGLDGPYGHWEPNAIEKRIIFDAIIWYRRNYIKSLLRKEIDR